MPSLARDCERRHNPPQPPTRGYDEILDPAALGGFHCRWYTHHGGKAIRFATPNEVTIYMARMGLPKPDEFLAPIAC